MTGFGDSHFQQDGRAVTVEVRAINNRFFKLSVRSSEGYGFVEPLVEAVVRKSVHRGTIQVNVWIERERSLEERNINRDVLLRYRRQLESLRQDGDDSRGVPWEALLALPGVVDEASPQRVDAEAEWPLIERVLRAAMENLDGMRRDEGRAMAADLAANCRLIGGCLERIERRAPAVVEDYRQRLHERVGRALADLAVSLAPEDLVKEVSLFADRGDISEEIVRLRSHLDQFQAEVESPESSGRKLDFLTQEMFREANTIGSKANDVEIARDVIELKTAVERVREMIQNIE
jgi:uncharacterized protein (TIGR00255 family)